MSVEEVGGFSVERFLLVFALVLMASKIFGELAERIKQPAVLGELVAGVILGASVLARVNQFNTVMIMLTTFVAPPLLKVTFTEGEAFPTKAKEAKIKASGGHGE